MMERLEQLKGKFWTNLEELRADIEELGFWVEELNAQYVTVYTNDEDYEDTEWVIGLILAGATFVVDTIEQI